MFENMQVGPKSVWTSDSTMLSELDMARRDHRFAFRQRHWGSSQTAPASPQVMTPQLTNEEEEEGEEEKGRRRRRRGGGTRRTRTRRARTRTEKQETRTPGSGAGRETLPCFLGPRMPLQKPQRQRPPLPRTPRWDLRCGCACPACRPSFACAALAGGAGGTALAAPEAFASMFLARLGRCVQRVRRLMQMQCRRARQRPGQLPCR